MNVRISGSRRRCVHRAAFQTAGPHTHKSLSFGTGGWQPLFLANIWPFSAAKYERRWKISETITGSSRNLRCATTTKFLVNYLGLPLSRQKWISDFSRRNGRQYVEQMHIYWSEFSVNVMHGWKVNHSTNKVQESYFVELPQSNFRDYTNSLTFP